MASDWMDTFGFYKMHAETHRQRAALRFKLPEELDVHAIWPGLGMRGFLRVNLAEVSGLITEAADRCFFGEQPGVGS